MKPSQIKAIAITLAVFSAFLLGRTSTMPSSKPLLLSTPQEVKTQTDIANENLIKFVQSFTKKPKAEDTTIDDVQLIRVLQYQMKTDGLQPMDTNWTIIAQKGSVQVDTQKLVYKNIHGDKQQIVFKKSDAREVLVSSLFDPNQLDYRFESKLPIK